MLHFFRNFTKSNSFADQCYKEARREFLISCQSDISMTGYIKADINTGCINFNLYSAAVLILASLSL